MNQTFLLSSVHTKILRSVSEVEEIRDVWTRLQRHPNSDLDFYLAIIGSRAEVIRPHVIVVYRDGVPDTLFIGRLEQRTVTFSLGYKRLCSVNARSLTFIYEGLLGSQSRENAAQVYAEIRKSLTQGEATLAVISSVNTESSIYEHANGLRGAWKAPHCAPPQPHWSITLPRNFEEFLGRFSLKVRRNRRQESARLHRAFPGGVSVECLSKPCDVDRMVADAEEIAQKTYHRGLGVGFVATDENRIRFMHDAIRDRLRMYILYLDNRPAAFVSGTMYGTTFHPSFMAFDPAHRKYSPGAFLFLHIVEELCDGVTSRIDLGFGNAWYKEHFCDHEWKESSIHMFAPNLAGLKLRILHTLTSFANTTATSLLTKSHLILKAKRIWRNRFVSVSR